MRNLPVTPMMFVTVLAASTLAALPAVAGDGVTEINHTLALAGAVTPDDKPGYPVELWSPGSYRLTSNLNQPDPNTDVIVVRADGVTVDLNGFTILGTNTCSGNPLVCDQAGIGDGVTASTIPPGITANRLATTIKNGTIRGMGGNGVHMFGGAVSVDHVIAAHNGRNGIDVSNSGSVTNCSAFQNGDDGIEATGSSTITGNRVWQNGDIGIETSLGFAGGVITGNVVHFNGGEGIYVRGTSALVKDNTITNNRDIGLRMGFGPSGESIGYADNILTSNDSAGTGVQVSGGTAIGTNVCNASTTC